MSLIFFNLFTFHPLTVPLLVTPSYNPFPSSSPLIRWSPSDFCLPSGFCHLDQWESQFLCDFHMLQYLLTFWSSGIAPRPSYTPGKCSATESHPSLYLYYVRSRALVFLSAPSALPHLFLCSFLLPLLLYPFFQLSWNSLCKSTRVKSIKILSASRVLGLQMSATMPSFASFSNSLFNLFWPLTLRSL